MAFQGERGGDAYDAELLALLRGVSEKSGAADRFSGGDDDDDFGNAVEEEPAPTLVPEPAPEPAPETAPASPKFSKRDPNELPPWKRGKAAAKTQPTTNDDVIVVASHPKPRAPPPKFEQPVSAFSGERGGNAHDEELLALLRGVSSGADRFAGDNENDDNNYENVENHETVNTPAAPPPSSRKKPTNSRRTNDEVPPWKRGKQSAAAKGNAAHNDDAIVIAAKPKPTQAQAPSSTPSLTEPSVLGGGGNFTKSSTFQGERGGDAHDEELLALLRGVSAKSSGADRFAGGDDEHEHEPANQQQQPLEEPPTNPKNPPKPKPMEEEKKEMDALPPWKRNKAQRTSMETEEVIDVVVASPRKPKPKSEDNLPPWKRNKAQRRSMAATAATEHVVDVVVASPKKKDQVPPEAVHGGGGNFSKTSNFQGDRGGDAHDEELLALLRGVSAQSSGSDRFAGGEEFDESFQPQQNATTPAPIEGSAPKAAPSRQSGRDPNDLPPWKREKTAKQNRSEAVSADVAVAVKPKPEPFQVVEETTAPGGGNFEKQTSAFQGERGGDAHDEELLALLRGVSSGANRFAGSEETTEQEAPPPPPQSPPPRASPTPMSPPPSATSIVSADTPLSASSKKKKWKMLTPPWKKKNKKKQEAASTPNKDSSQEILVASKTPKQHERQSSPELPHSSPKSEASSKSEGPVEGGRGDFRSGPSSFQGERGGDAHDEELLALLRGVSSSKNNDRFDDGSKVGEEQSQDPVKDDSPVPAGRGTFQSAPSTFQGERGGDAHDEELLALLRGASSSKDRFAEDSSSNKDDVETETKDSLPQEHLPVQGGRGNFKQESTFQGERGGDAHDEELLALLRGVSSNTSSAVDRFSESADELPKVAVASPQPRTPAQSSFAFTASSMPSPFPPAGGIGDTEIELTIDDLPSAFSDKNWKIRKESYIVLKDAITKAVSNGTRGSTPSDSILSGLDDWIPKLMAEKNAVALEFALQAGTEYADGCQGASSEERAVAIVQALLKGNGFSSPRPASGKFATAFVLKLMEVGDSPDSLKSIVSLLVEKGWTSKKPKVVQLSISLVLDATHSFGAAHLPLAGVASGLPKVLTHSNKKIRDTGMEVVAELCRSFQSKDPLESVVGKMQKAQVKDLDTLLGKRADPIPPKTGLRCSSSSGGGTVDILAALQAGSEELEKERFAKRPAVKLICEISKTDYSSQLKEAKWSKKVAALDTVLKCGGEKPYKLAQPSSSNNYTPLIIEMKGLLTHTHFAVVSKAMSVLGMLAQGVGEKLFPNIRPLLPKLLQLSKDKKLTNAVSACLDACFGNVFGFEHLMDSDASIPEATNESKEKNALARTSALDYVDRCVTRGASAGPRASLTPDAAKSCARLASNKLGDSDANVRKSALKLLTSLQSVEDENVEAVVGDIVNELQQSNPRAYKTLSKTAGKPAKARSSIPEARQASAKKGPAPIPSSPGGRKPSTKSKPATRPPAAPKISAAGPTPVALKPARENTSTSAIDLPDGETPSYEEALSHCESLGIPRWDEPEGDDENEGGVLAGMKSSKWQFRQKAMKEIIGFVKTCPPMDDARQIENDSNALLVVVKEHSKKFKESNVNLARCILELFSALCDYHERSQCRIAKWASSDGTALAVEKISDRKLSPQSKSLLLSLCVVHPPHAVLASACACAAKLRAPLAHEEFLNWIKEFCNSFGAASIGAGLQDMVAFLVSESGSKNVKVKRAAFAAAGLVYTQIGPSFKAVALTSVKDASLREEFEKLFIENPFDSSLRSKDWPMRYIIADSSGGDGAPEGSSGTSMQVDLPKTDLVSELPSDCVSRMGSKDGKTAWKARKAALEDVEKALKASSGLLDTSRMKPLVDLLRAMRDRLSDSQSNLKPLAARLIGLLLGSVEGEAQGKLGKVVYGPILNAAMSDKRKVMNDAAMEALKKGVSIPELQGEGFNEQSLEPFVVALTGQLEESEFKSAGIAGILEFTESLVSQLPNLDNVSSQRGETVGGRFASVLVDGLSSSKADIRSAAESVLSACIANDVFSMQTAKKCSSYMVPAKQRSVGMILAKISSSNVGHESQSIPEPSPAKPSRSGKGRIPPAERTNAKPAIQKPKPTNARAMALKSRISTHPRVTDDGEDVVEGAESSNPLVHDLSSTGIQKSRAAMRSLTWPEYPEEPSGSGLYSGLKKAWSPIIPPDSTKKLFPDRGIRNQSDVMDAFDLLRQAIDLDQQDQGSIVIDQLHFILRWSVFVMGCKESAVGLTGLLDMLSELISYLNGRMYEFSDSEVALFVPFLLEKASVAKGRFKDSYVDLIQSMKSDALISEKRLGPLVCVPLMESSVQAKARLLACQNCYHCVEAIGLSGIGKKGVLVAAKSLSNEKLPDNKAALLDLLVLLVSRMNNDVQRLSKICGSSLSLKARSLIEEQMHKAPSPVKGPPPTKIPTPQKASRLPRPSVNSPPSKLSRPPTSRHVESDFKFTAPSVFEDKLPALDLRRALRERGSPVTSPTKASGLRPTALSFGADGSSLSSAFRESSNTATRSEQFSANLASASGESDYLSGSTLGSSSISKPASSPVGAAASLRARLLKIRETNKLNSESKPSESISIPMQQVAGSVTGDSFCSMDYEYEPLLDSMFENVRGLLVKSCPITELDDDLLSCTDVLKNIHAAVSKQSNLAVMISGNDVTNLREEIRERASEVVGILTQLIGFGFGCHAADVSAGMSVPLLSVDLAGLMAIFRSSDLATVVSVDDLTILIKEAGTALLDPRLAPSSKPGENTLALIDEATSTQMVRAINKLAVQAATGAARENSLQALIRLQEQLSSNVDLCEDPQFNSRLSRVVTKLLSRVIKAEEGAPQSFTSANMDMETVLCCLEDTCSKLDEGGAETKNMAKLVVMAILKARGESNSLGQELEELGIDPQSSALGHLVGSCATELGLATFGVSNETSQKDDVALLVSAVVSASQGPERTAAIDALRSYKETHGDEELINHLQDVSPAFRDYLLNELSAKSRPASPTVSNVSNASMSERIKNLRSKLNATEASVANVSNATQNPPLPPQMDQQQRMENLRAKLNATKASRSQATSTRVPPIAEPENTDVDDSSSNPTISAFRERLAAAKGKQKASKSASTDVLSPMPSVSASNRAAALRARLQAVKMQNKI